MQPLAIGIDIGGTNVSYGVVGKIGNIKNKDSFSIKNYPNVEPFVTELGKRINQMLDHLKDEFWLAGIGIGAPNGNYYSGTIEYAPNLDWNGIIPLADMIHEELKVPSFLTNDANAAALGELIYGGAKGMNDFLMVTLGTGVGSGFVSNGEMILGHDGFAGELGHTYAIPDGRLCGCGRNGCLETYTSATGIVRTVVELLEQTDTESKLRKIGKDQITAKSIYDAAKDGDKLALDAFDYTAKILGRSLADAVAITSPEAIFLFGGLANAKEFIFDQTKEYMEHYMLDIFKDKVKLLPSSLPENDAAILGAAALVWKEVD